MCCVTKLKEINYREYYRKKLHKHHQPVGSDDWMIRKNENKKKLRQQKKNRAKFEKKRKEIMTNLLLFFLNTHCSLITSSIRTVLRFWNGHPTNTNGKYYCDNRKSNSPILTFQYTQNHYLLVKYKSIEVKQY